MMIICLGVPIDAQSLVVYYNKDLLADLGETLPANREELFEVCGKAKAQGLTPIAWSTSNGYFNSYLFRRRLSRMEGSCTIQLHTKQIGIRTKAIVRQSKMP